MSSPRNPKTLAEWLELDYFRRPRPLKALWKPVLLATLAAVVVAVIAVARAAEEGCAPPGHHLPGRAAGHLRTPCSTMTAASATSMRSRPGIASGSSTPPSAPSPTRPVANATPGPSITPTSSAPRTASVSVAIANTTTRSHSTAFQTALAPPATSIYRPASRAGSKRTSRTSAPSPGIPTSLDAGKEPPGTRARLPSIMPFICKPAGVLKPCPEQGANLPEKDRREQRQVLQCKDCHVPDAAGRFMQPVRYESHCQECHPLTVGIPLKADAAGMKKALADFSRTPVPHRGPEVVRADLRERLTQFIKDHPDFLQAEPKGNVLPRPIPGSKPSRPELVSKEEFEWVGRQLIQVEKPLFHSRTGCAYCHQESKPGPTARRANCPSFSPRGSTNGRLRTTCQFPVVPACPLSARQPSPARLHPMP